jgi:hypothetical protein
MDEVGIFGIYIGIYMWPFGLFCVHLVNFPSILSILRPFGIFCVHLIYFMAIWYIFRRFRMFQEQSGHPGFSIQM